MKKIILITSLLIFASGCRSNSELSMERGEYFYSIGKLEDATLEYNKVISNYSNSRKLNRKDTQTLANAHHNLAVVWFKRGYESDDPVEKSSYLNIANSEAKQAYFLYPKDLYKETWDKIQKAIKK
tara:strand:- start:170 stop:547 length:378 start_codon:yes stop_codon:yes gene_type:complete